MMSTMRYVRSDVDVVCVFDLFRVVASCPDLMSKKTFLLLRCVRDDVYRTDAAAGGATLCCWF